MEQRIRARYEIVTALRAKSGAEYALAAHPQRWILGSGAQCDLVFDDPYVSATHLAFVVSCCLAAAPGASVASLLSKSPWSKQAPKRIGNWGALLLPISPSIPAAPWKRPGHTQ